ncbi:Leucine-rich repeat [Macleaya cordata]|uniref:Leucine-rich repeat n=1 Tax=Macleaya cordata TaxID=56857 RepID=A0A200R3H3_MACCD|nr:Leucine-rich repeat [Macleaya cordata]
MKKQKSMEAFEFKPFDLLNDEILFAILDCLEENPVDKKSFSLVCKSFYFVESQHRKTLRPLPSDFFRKILNRYPFVSNLDLSLCPRITDNTLSMISSLCNSTLRSINLSRSKFFSHVGLSSLLLNCLSLVELDLSNATELTDSAASVIREAKNLEKLWLARCVLISDLGIGCIAVGCRKLKLLSLKWCFSVTDLGVGLIAVKCKEIRSLDLSYVPITNKCLPSILQLQYLNDLVLVGCAGLDDEGLTNLRQGSMSLETLNLSDCQNVSHVGLSSLTNGAGCLRQLIIAYGPPVTLALTDSMQRLPKLQSVKLDGCQITSSALKAIGYWCISLRELSLSKCSGVTDDGLSFLVTRHKELRKLDITCCREITRVSIDNITTSCTSLTSLRMESCNLVSEEAFISIGQNCHFLEELDFTDSEVDNEGLKSISRCSGLSVLRIGICLNITDEGLIHVGMHCPKLIELDLYRSAAITDLGIAAIANGCRMLEMINIAYSKDITDSSLISLSKCSRLSILEMRGCPCISSMGLSAIAVGCKQLTRLDIKSCFNINDSGMVRLAHFSKNLKQINLSYCSVTDIGLLALASISCLQNVTILHMRGLTANDLAAALVACRGLTKVKLHSTFKSLLPQPFIEHIESRGCAFQWRDKPFQVAVDARSWKRQLEATL